MSLKKKEKKQNNNWCSFIANNLLNKLFDILIKAFGRIIIIQTEGWTYRLGHSSRV